MLVAAGFGVVSKIACMGSNHFNTSRGIWGCVVRRGSCTHVVGHLGFKTVLLVFDMTS